MADVRKILNDAVVWDNHACMPLRCDSTFLPQLERYRASGTNVVSLNVGYAHMTWEEHLAVLSFMRFWIDRHRESYSLISSSEDIRACKDQGKLGIVFDIEGMGPVEENIHLIKSFYDLGVRWMLIAYNHNNKAGGGCMDEDSGLTGIGRDIIDEMERVGMVLCLSHAGPRTAAEALEYSRNPPIFSHSNPYRCNSHPRNVSDDLIRKCAEKGGVFGLSGIGDFIGSNDLLANHLLDQLKYVVDLVGPFHVGLGLDFVFDLSELDDHVRKNPGLYPAGIQSGLAMVPPEALSFLAEGLFRDGLTEVDVKAILGGNWLRIAERVWQ